MRAIQDRVSMAAREQVSWQIAVGTMLADALVQGLRQYADLNMGMLRASLDQGNIAARQLATAKDARQFASLAAAQIQPGALRGMDYGYYLATLMAEMQAGVVRAFAIPPGMDGSQSAYASFLEGPWFWQFGLSLLKGMTDSAVRFPTDLARAARLALNINTPAWESGKLRIAYARPSHAAG